VEVLHANLTGPQRGQVIVAQGGSFDCGTVRGLADMPVPGSRAVDLQMRSFGAQNAFGRG
jgi:hypothetical protein